MASITVRPAVITDCSAFCTIHRDCEDPWRDAEECRAWVGRRLGRGFYIQAALYGDKIVGHGEWIVSDEPGGRYLYLGMLHVDSDYQHKGVGRAMLEDGIRYAGKNGCKYISTIPDTETGSESFYAKCGFRSARVISSCILPVEGGTDCQAVERISGVPLSAVSEKTFVFGLSQVSSRHMWEVCNAPPDTSDRLTPAVLLGDEAYIQLSYFPGDEVGLVLCWSNSRDYRSIIDAALHMGADDGLKELEFIYFSELDYLFGEKRPIKYGDEVILDYIVPLPSRPAPIGHTGARAAFP